MQQFDSKHSETLSGQNAQETGCRLTGREAGSGSWGADAPLPTLRAVHESLRDFFLDNGFKLRTYQIRPEDVKVATQEGRKVAPPLAEAFYRADEPLRKEPILIDNGGRVIGRRPVLSIAVRPSEEALVFRQVVGQMLFASGIHPARALQFDQEIIEMTRPEHLSTLVFRIKPLPPPSFSGMLAQWADSAASALFPQRDPAPVPLPLPSRSASQR